MIVCLSNWWIQEDTSSVLRNTQGLFRVSLELIHLSVPPTWGLPLLFFWKENHGFVLSHPRYKPDHNTYSNGDKWKCIFTKRNSSYHCWLRPSPPSRLQLPWTCCKLPTCQQREIKQGLLSRILSHMRASCSRQNLADVRRPVAGVWKEWDYGMDDDATWLSPIGRG